MLGRPVIDLCVETVVTMPFMKWNFINLFSITVGLLLSSGCQTVEADELRLDNRTYSDSSGSRYYVAIVARGGSPTGHAFVVWGKEDARRRISIQQAWGFYPKSGSGFFGSVPGVMRNEAFNPRSTLITDRVIIEVNRETFEQTLSIVDKWRTTDYRLFSRNCISFIREVAQGTNTLIPAWNRLDFPATHVQKIIARNRRAR